jgi:hypothetical protein
VAAIGDFMQWGAGQAVGEQDANGLLLAIGIPEANLPDSLGIGAGLLGDAINGANACGKATDKTGTLPVGSFSIADWSGYPANLPIPAGPFRLLEGAEYDAARAQANAANQAMHQANPALNGLQLHEIQPVKFGGSPTDPLNKIPLTPQQHAPATTWWNQLQSGIE